MQQQSAEVDDLPPPSIELAIGGIVMMELEKRLPGLIEDCRLRAEAECHRSAAILIRGPKVAPQTRAALDGAHRWFALLTAFAEATYGKPKKRWRRR